jgi:chromosome segregation ATPase
VLRGQAEAREAEAEHTVAGLLEQAQAREEEAEREAATLVEEAEGRVGEIVDAFRREHEEIAWSMEAARAQVDQLSDQVHVAAAEGARAMQDGLRPHVDDLRRQYEDLEAERLEAVRQVARVRESLRLWTRHTAPEDERSA